MKNYVTYLESGVLTSGVLQDVAPQNLHIEVTEEIRRNWCLYQMNAARDGVELAPVVPQEVQVPQVVTMRQARLALNAAGLLSAVQTAINAGSTEAKITWEYSSEVQRNNGLVPTMAASLGMTEAQIDGLFIAAAAL